MGPCSVRLGFFLIVSETPNHKGKTMTSHNPGLPSFSCAYESRISAALLEKWGPIGPIVYEAWNEVDPLHCLVAPDEYLGYVERFLASAASVTARGSCEQSDRLDLVEELVRRCFYISQVCRRKSDGLPWVTAEEISMIATLIEGRVRQLGEKEWLSLKS